MKKTIALIITSIALFGCSNSQIDAEPIETIKLDELSLGPITHESLNDDQLKKIKYIQESLIEVYPISIEESIENFKRDQNPDNEIEIWINIVEAYNIFALENNEAEQLSKRKEAFKLILMRSMMPENEAIKSSELILLTDIEIQDILNNYQLEAKPIKIK